MHEQEPLKETFAKALIFSIPGFCLIDSLHERKGCASLSGAVLSEAGRVVITTVGAAVSSAALQVEPSRPEIFAGGVLLSWIIGTVTFTSLYVAATN